MFMYRLLYSRSLAHDDSIVGVALGYALDTRWNEQRPCVRVLMKASTTELDVATVESEDKVDDDLKKKVSEEVTRCVNKSHAKNYSAEDYESWLKFTSHDPNQYKCTELYSDPIVPGITNVPVPKETDICDGGTMGLMVRVKLEANNVQRIFHFGLTCAHTVLNNILKSSDSVWVHCKKWKSWNEIENPFKGWESTQTSSSPSIPTHTKTQATPKETYLYRIAPTLFPRILSDELRQINWRKYQTVPICMNRNIRCCCTVCGWFGGNPVEAVLHPNDQQAMIDIAALSVSNLESTDIRCWPKINGIDKWEVATDITDIFPQSGATEELPVYTYNIREEEFVERRAILCNEVSVTDFASGHHLYNLIFLDNETEQQKFAKRGDSGSIVYTKVRRAEITVAVVLGMIYGGNSGRQVFGFPLYRGIELLSFELCYAAAKMFLESPVGAEDSTIDSLYEYTQTCKKRFYDRTNQPIANRVMPEFCPPKEFKFSIVPCLGSCGECMHV